MTKSNVIYYKGILYPNKMDLSICFISIRFSTTSHHSLFISYFFNFLNFSSLKQFFFHFALFSSRITVPINRSTVPKKRSKFVLFPWFCFRS